MRERHEGMFTGIVEEVGEVVAVVVGDAADRARITVRGPLVTSDASDGDSIAVDGICVTVVETGRETFTAELMTETLVRTTADEFTVGRRVNLERSVTANGRLGGHVVQGHVDGVGTVTARVRRPGHDEVTIRVPSEVGRLIAPKGAVAVDGISLTVIDVTDGPGGTEFDVGIIPQTRTVTTMGGRSVGDTVNIEVDVMAKYVARLWATAEVTR